MTFHASSYKYTVKWVKLAVAVSSSTEPRYFWRFHRGNARYRQSHATFQYVGCRGGSVGILAETTWYVFLCFLDMDVGQNLGLSINFGGCIGWTSDNPSYFGGIEVGHQGFEPMPNMQILSLRTLRMSKMGQLKSDTRRKHPNDIVLFGKGWTLKSNS